MQPGRCVCLLGRDASGGTVAQLEKGQRPPGAHLGPVGLHSCPDKAEGLQTLLGLLSCCSHDDISRPPLG